MHTHLTSKRWLGTNAALFALMLIALAWGIHTGSEPVGFVDAFGVDAKARAIVMLSRLPRVMLAMFVGLALSSSGGAYQILLRNPLADPFLLGVSGGAALGSVLAVGLGLPPAGISIFSFAGALLSLLFIFFVARTHGRLPPATLLLTGVIFNAFCFAFILFVNAMVPMEEAYEILTLLIGSLDVVDFGTITATAVFVLSGFIVLCALSWRMNLLALGDDEARTLGVNPDTLRIKIFVASSLMVGAAVAVSGLIGFVGLFIPHIARMLFGSDSRLVIPASGFLGAIFLVFADTVARTVLMNTALATQLPVGVITALAGAPLFIILLRRGLTKT